MAYKGKVGLVTGAASGMGKIITTRMVKRGMQIAAIDTNKDGLKELGKKYNNVMPLECDVCSFKEMKEVVEKTESRLGDISSFIHAAAIMPAEPILSTNPDRTMKLMDINYGGTVNAVHSIIPLMIRRGSGQAVFFGSIAGQVLNTGLAPYSATKSAVNTYIEILQRETKDSGVHIMLVQPNMVDTPLIDQALGKESPKNIKLSKESGRLANPTDIVRAIEKGLSKNKLILYPNTEARLLTLARRFFPNILWSIIEKSNK